MKKYYFIFILSLLCSKCIAQKELWGCYESVMGYAGTIDKFDINAQNPQNMHQFNVEEGGNPNPIGKLFLASNGNLYGTSNIGALSSNGILFEYNLTLNKYRVVHNIFTGSARLQSGIVEPTPGKLYLAIASSIYSYDLVTEAFTFCNALVDNVIIRGGLTKASNGFIYGTTCFNNVNCPNLSPLNSNYGTIFKFNPTTNAIQTVYRLNCNYIDGFNPVGGLVELTPNKLYGAAISGSNIFTTTGAIFEFNTITNAYTRKIDFEGFNLGAWPSEIIDGGNGKLFGVCNFGGANTNNSGSTFFGDFFGTLFEYTPATNTLSKLHDFGANNGLDVFTRNPTSIMKTSLGKFMITTASCSPSQFYPMDNSIVQTASGCILNPNSQIGVPYAKSNLTEICRKPSYQEFLPNTYAPEQGTTFTYNIQNTNATTYVWKKGTSVLSTQTTGILSLPSVTASDTGIYTCTMTNECGTTVTMPLNINVTNLGTDSIVNYKDFISLFPNPTKGSINLKFPENRGMKAVSFKITNLLGQVVLQNDIAKSNTATTIIIDTASFANGIYQVTLVTDKGNWNGKFVKE